MNPERAFYNLVGIRKESPRIRWYSVAAFEIFSKLDSILNRTIIEGTLPSEGAALVVSMHTSMWDIAKGYQMVKQSAHRLMRGIARDTLLNTNLKDSEQVLDRTGKKNDPLNTAPKLVRKLLAFILTGIDSIGVPRGANTLSALRPTLRDCDKTFSENRIVGIFDQETRIKEGDLRNLMDGPAFLARLHPDIPIYPVSIHSRSKPHRVRIGQPFTVNEARTSPKFLTNVDQTLAIKIFIADQTANIANDEVKADWYGQRRQENLQKSTKN